MKIIKATLAVLVVFCLNAALATAQDFDTKAYCKKLGDMAGGSSELELYCRQSEEQAKQNIAGMKASDRAMKHCTELGLMSGGSYELMEHCLKEESRAEQKLAGESETSSSPIEGLPNYDVTVYCKKIGDMAGGSSELELYCRQSEEGAKQRVIGLKVSDRAMKYCDRLSQTAGGSYELLEYCLQEETAAEKELKQ